MYIFSIYVSSLKANFLFTLSLPCQTHFSQVSFFYLHWFIFFTLVISSSSHINNYDHNVTYISTLDGIFEFLNGIHVEKLRSQFKMEVRHCRHNMHWYNDNVQVTFFKTLFGFGFYVENFHPCIHALLQKVMMPFYLS